MGFQVSHNFIAALRKFKQSTFIIYRCYSVGSSYLECCLSLDNFLLLRAEHQNGRPEALTNFDR